MKLDADIELIEYLCQQFPAAIGHRPLAAKIQAVRRQGMLEAAEIADKMERDDGENYGISEAITQSAAAIGREGE